MSHPTDDRPLGEVRATLLERFKELPLKDQHFAESVARAAPPTPRQEYWVRVLSARVQGAAPATSVATAVDFAPLVAFMQAAHDAGIQYPKIKMTHSGGQPLVIARAGVRSANPGQLSVTDGGPYGDNQYYGRITVAGEFQQGHSIPPGAIKVLQALNANPTATAAKYGQVSGRCCFCRTPLSAGQSLAVGYGPTCADNYGLPWGAQ